jgi:hypothetical protein
MAHEIETHGNRAAAVFARKDAWHRLGTTLTDVFTAEQAMTVGHLGGWNVRKTPLTTVDLDADGVSVMEVPGHFATVRTNPFTGAAEPLGVVGEGYRPIQNEDHCEILNSVMWTVCGPRGTRARRCQGWSDEGPRGSQWGTAEGRTAGSQW